jgi:hypothetical protein
MPTNTSLTARQGETYELLRTSPDGSLRLWHDQGENPGYKIVYHSETVWFRPPTRHQWRKDRADAIAMVEAMAADVGLTVAEPVKSAGISITGTAPRGPENREHLAMLGRLYGEHVEVAFGEGMEPKARPDRGRKTQP